MRLTAVDTVLDDCFQLVSLAYMTIGKNHEAPAVYVFPVLITARPALPGHVLIFEQVLSHLNSQGKLLARTW
jgi:hypothetical protein